jgi:uroporphyrinogen III methyltransferase/synthase
LPQDAVNNGFTNPSLIVVGNVVKLRDRLNWFEERPLFGKNIVVTRAREQASGMAHGLALHGAQVTSFPTIHIEPLDSPEIDKAVHELTSYDIVIFTSANGVDCFMKRMNMHRRDSRFFGKCVVAAIGSATAETLANYGIMADVTPKDYVAESLLESLREYGVKGRKILLARAKEARDVLPDGLRRAGAQVDVLPVYITRQYAQKHGADNARELCAAFEANQVDCVTFGSSSTVDNFFAQIPPDLARSGDKVRFACIGPITARTLAGYGFESHINPSEYTVPALVDAIVRHYSTG